MNNAIVVCLFMSQFLLLVSYLSMFYVVGVVLLLVRVCSVQPLFLLPTLVSSYQLAVPS
ncbi:unnamed protein product [Arabidopsis lyrata]|nr:unnamed protein product [Arabidopsis lyrata]